MLLKYTYSLTLATWLKEQFILADNGGKGRLNEKEVLSVVRQLNEQIPESVIKQRFKVGDSYSLNASLNISNIYLMCFFLDLPCWHPYKLNLCMGISNKIEVSMITIDEATIIVIPIKFGISHPMMAKKSAKKCAVRVFVNFAY